MGAAAGSQYYNPNPHSGESFAAMPPKHLHLRLPIRMHVTGGVVFSTFPVREIASIARIMAQYAAKHTAPARNHRNTAMRREEGGKRRAAQSAAVIFFTTAFWFTHDPTKKRWKGPTLLAWLFASTLPNQPHVSPHHPFPRAPD